jgi:4-hydroxybenzoyl-CoA reductase subunit alpha
MKGNAVKIAARDAKSQLLEFAQAKMEVNIVHDLDIKNCWIRLIDRPDRGVFYYDIVKQAIRGKDGELSIGCGHHRPHRKGVVSPAYSFGVQACEVKVDPETGKYRLVEAASAHESGAVVMSLGITRQLDGAIQMADGPDRYGLASMELNCAVDAERSLQ